MKQKNKILLEWINDQVDIDLNDPLLQTMKSKIDEVIDLQDENFNYVKLAYVVAQILNDHYNENNRRDFIVQLNKYLK